jgi:hypothetical protein
LARAPYSPVPDVEPTAPSPARLNIQASPADFGAQIGQAEQRFGADSEQAGNTLFGTAMAVQERHNEVAVDNAFNTLQQKNLNRLFGDPNNPNQKGYFALRGADAMNAQAGTVDGMEQDRAAIKNTLQNPAQQLLFEQQSRRMNMYQQESIGRHAAQQASLWDIQTQQAGEETKLRAIGLNYNDETDFQHNLADGMATAQKKAAAAGGGPDIIQNTAQQFREKAYTARVMGMASTNPVQAYQYLQQHQDQFNPATFDQLQDHLKTKARGVQAGSIADAAYTGGKMPVTGPDIQPSQQGLTPTKVMNGLIHTEGSGPSAVSPAGATGQAQIIRSTFNEYALPGESYANEDDRRSAAKRYVDDMWKKYPGDVGRMAVGYFSGTGNIAPQGSPTPWKQNLSDGISTTQQYATRLTNTVAPQVHATTPVMYPDKNQAYQRVMDATGGDEQLMDSAIQKLNLRYAIEAKAKQDAGEAAESDYVPKIMKDPTSVTPEQLANDPRLALNPDKMWQLNQRREAALREGAVGTPDSHDVKTYGPGFYQAFQGIHAAQGDPSRITDPSQLWGRVGPTGDLTVAGVDKLTAEMNGKKTPEGEADAKMKAGALAYAKNEISFEKDFGTFKIRDPKGEGIFGTGFTPAFYKAYDDGLKAGKTPYQMLSKDSPDFIVDKLVSVYKRKPEDIQRDMLEENDGTGAAPAGGTTAAPAQDLKSQAGIVQAYQKGQIDRVRASQLLVDGGFASPAAPPAPTPPR